MAFRCIKISNDPNF